MKNTFYKTEKPELGLWTEMVKKLEKDMEELVSTQVPEEEVKEYVATLMNQYTRPEYRPDHLFLLCDDPNTMPSDARVDFVYRPTYIAASIMMAAAMRYPSVWKLEHFEEDLYDLLNGSMGRGFMGSGYDANIGLLDTLELFAKGRVADFLHRYPEINPKFTKAFNEAVTFLETDVCTGKMKDSWSGKTFIQRGEKILEEIRAVQEEAAEDGNPVNEK